jgi:uncharacterized protein with HEPN domain
MPSREVRKYLYDIAVAAEYIAQFTAGKTYEEYCTDPMLRSEFWARATTNSSH